MNKHPSPENLHDATPAPRAARKAAVRARAKAKPAAAKRTCIMVLGMHRTGTSALTRAISLLGADLPKNMLGANPTNQAGHWEPERLIAVHDRMLAEAGSRWDDWRAFDPAVLGEERVARYRDEIKTLLLEEFGNGPLFVLKDPRICRFMPLYESVLADLGVTPLFVLPNRNPLAVIASLGKRDGMTADFACFVWLRHVLDAEAATRGKRRSFVSYEAFLRDWRGTVGRMGEALDFSWPTAIDEAAAEIEAHLRPDLQHHVSSWAELKANAGVEAWVRDAYTALCDLDKREPESRAALDELARIRREFDKASAVFGKAIFPELAAREQQASQQGKLLADRARQAEADRSALQGALASLEAEMSALRAHQPEPQQDAEEKNALAGRLATLASEFAEQARSVATLHEATAQRAIEIAAARHEVAAREYDLAALRAESSALSARVSGLVEENAALKERQAGLASELSAARETIASMSRESGAARETISARDADITRLAGEKIVYESQAAHLLADRDNARLEEKRLHGVLDAVYASTSWRLTKPLRGLKLGARAIGNALMTVRGLSLYFGRRASLLPMHDVAGHDVSGSVTEWTITGNDPHFELGWSPAYALPPGHYNFRIDLLNRSETSTSARLYIDSGKGYNEADSIGLHNQSKRAKSFNAHVPLYIAAQRLRFDPSDGPGNVTTGQVTLRKLTRAEHYSRLIWRQIQRQRHGGRSTGAITARAISIIRQRGVRGLVARLREAGGVSHVNQVARIENGHGEVTNADDRFYRYTIELMRLPNKVSGIDTVYVPRAEDHVFVGSAPLQTIAFYLPQFHPIPENDKWWGSGFTEWTNVSKAVPQYLGHYQPRLPGDLGFYDLRLIDIMRQQAEMARQYGIAGFCFHHYWFAGKRLLERPVRQLLAAKDIDIDFCLCWANENWTRRWDGQEQDILLAQEHSPEDDIAFIDDIMPCFRDGRYIKFQGKPVLVVYRVSLLPDPAATAARWRKRCIEAGVGDLYLVAARSFEITDPRPFGFDAAIEFPPHQIPASRINDQLTIINPEYRGNIYDYRELAQGYARQQVSGYPLIKTVTPSWDNEARKPGAGHTFHGSSPAAYADWLRQAYRMTDERVKIDAAQPPFVFVNAWNEWAEGAHLEPDRKHGYAYLHATANVIREFVPPHPEVADIVRTSQETFAKRYNTAVVLHLHYDDLLEEMRPHVESVKDADIFISTRAGISPDRCRDIVSAFPRARLEIYPNRGRDIQPFLGMLRLLRREGYEFACKIHSKKSLQRKDGARLRRGALDDLLGSKAKVDAILRRFRRNPSLGVIAPKGTLLRLDDPDRNVLNREWLDRLLADAGMGDLAGNYRCSFVAGSMFWFRLGALASIDELDLQAGQFEDELGQVDGTLAHAVERLFAAAAEKSGFKIEEV